ncbi:MAG: CRISPR-associated endonuclease Cas2 [Candidatus Pacebacteria bacterium]|nr:CRISPR-associated endonuclease Cas2 [Candidatus Paceibacterota bacterium]
MSNINYQKIILKTVVAVGLIGIAVVAPNALQVVKQFSPNKKKWVNERYYLSETIKKLLEKGLLEKVRKGNSEFIKITKKGKEMFAKYELGDLEIKKPKRWDKKWRVVIFDVEEKKRNLRNLLRSNLERIGFVKLQNSVWVFPYECEELIFLLKTNFFVDSDVLYMEVNRIENESRLKEFFGLK